MKIIKKILPAALSMALVLTGTIAGAPKVNADFTLNDGLVAYYPFNNSLADQSGNGNDGQAIGNLTYKYEVDGPYATYGPAVVFDGSSYIEVPDSDKLDLTTNAYTMSVWIYKDDNRPQNEQPILTKLNSSKDPEIPSYTFSDRDAQPYVYLWDMNDNYSAVDSGNFLDFQEFIMLTVTYDGSSVKYYQNGVLMSSKPVKCTIPASSGCLQIGCNNVDGTSFFKGAMDDLRIYNRALKPEEVKSLFDIEDKAKDHSGKLVAYYKFDNDLKDSSGYDNNGTAIGPISFENAIADKGARFDGHSYVEVKDNDALHLNKGYTFSSWLYKEDSGTGNEQPILSKLASSKDIDIPSYTFSDRDNIPYVYMFDTNDNEFAVYPDKGIDINKWTYVTVTFDGKEVRFFYDGSLAYTKKVSCSVPNSSGSLMIGFNTVDSSSFFKGGMDDLRIYNYALSDKDVKVLYDYTKPATDTPSDWAVSEINKAKELNLTTQKVLTNYQSNITREEFCEMAVKLYEAVSGFPAAPVTENPFKDTTNSEVLKAYNMKIVNGTSDTEFSPNAPITRQEISVMLLRTLKAAQLDLDINTSEIARFEDEDQIADWALDAVKFFNKNGILKGEGTISISITPEGNTTKEQAIALVKRTLEKFKAVQ